MAQKRNNKTLRLAVKGFFRLQIVDKKTRKVIGDTGDMENQITNYGLNCCIVAAPIKGANSVQVSGILLGSGTNPASNATALDGSLTAYWSAAGVGIGGSTQGQLTQTFDGTLGAVTIANIGLMAASTGSLICGKTFASSALATTQDVNVSYNLNYTTS